MPNVGDQLPDITLSDDQGQEIKLQTLPGPYVLYLYPKDDTPGCTKEACAFRDNYGAFKAAGVQVYGVSPDSVTSHTKFREKYHLPFPLLADTDHRLADALGMWGEKKFMGKSFTGVQRSTFVIGTDGTIEKVYPDVKPDEHAMEILRYLGKA
ncbi:MAG: thioredoxin-dependent thiol peroxidase [Herpetosiphonaceae bacterium]|nr:thioredoxin-dependent thiol peroxidase [Herpetosiphonaceae bacterium]